MQIEQIIAALVADFRRPDPAGRFAALARWEALDWTEPAQAAWRAAVAAEDDPACRAVLQRLAARLDRNQPCPPPGCLAREIDSLLENPARDELQLVLALQEVTLVEAPLVALSLRAAGWTGLSAPALPFVLRFFRAFGSFEDAQALEELCRHPDPRVLGAAVEALERIHPESLKDLIVPLLVNPVPGIRSRAVRLLYRWDPQEALRHFEALLFSDDPAERAAALTHAVFFPFPSISEILLRFLGQEGDAELLQQAGALVAANPSPESPPRLAELRRARSGAARAVLDGVLQAVVQALAAAGLIREAPAAFLSRLTGESPEGRGVGRVLGPSTPATGPSSPGPSRGAAGDPGERTNAPRRSSAGFAPTPPALAQESGAAVGASTHLSRPSPSPAPPPYAPATIQEMRRRQASRPPPAAPTPDSVPRTWILGAVFAVFFGSLAWLVWSGMPGRGSGSGDMPPLARGGESGSPATSAHGPEVWLEGTILLLDPAGQGILVRADRPEPGKFFVQGFGAKGLAGLTKGGRFAGKVRIIGKERLTTIADLVP